MSRFSFIIFDWDGTLMDSEACIVRCMQAAAVDMKLAVPAYDAVKNIIGLGLTEAVNALFPHADAAFVQDIANQYRVNFLHPDEAGSQLFDGAEALLIQLHQAGFKLAVATGKGRRGLDHVLTQTGLGQFFVATACADETASKPNPLMVNEMLHQLNISPDQALMVGDTEFDLEMATNAKMASVGMTHGVHDVARLRLHHPLACFDQLSDLGDWLIA